MSDEKRVVLVKPGDVLLIGGVDAGRHSSMTMAEATQAFSRLTGIPIVVFRSDIAIDSLTREDVQRFAGLYPTTDTP